jgi:hypothetical protein
MSSAWGKSWGKAWGNSWGVITSVVAFKRLISSADDLAYASSSGVASSSLGAPDAQSTSPNPSVRLTGITATTTSPGLGSTMTFPATISSSRGYATLRSRS